MNVRKASSKIGHARLSNDGWPSTKPAGSSSAPDVSDRNVIHAVSRDAGMGLPITTGNICCIAPTMMIAMKPSVMQCVAASNAGVCGSEKGLSVPDSNISAASSRNNGATAKKRSGTEIGGACSVLSETVFMRAADANRITAIFQRRGLPGIAGVAQHLVKRERFAMDMHLQDGCGRERRQCAHDLLEWLGRRQSAHIQLVGHVFAHVDQAACMRSISVSRWPAR